MNTNGKLLTDADRLTTISFIRLNESNLKVN